jgi:hypothetical protein
MIGIVFLRNKIEEVAKQLKKSLGYPFWDVYYLINRHEKCQNMAKLSPKKRNI